MNSLIICNKFGDELEAHTFSNGSLVDWLIDNVPSYSKISNRHPYSAVLNGEDWPHEFHNQELTGDNQIIVIIEPQEPVTVFYVIALIAAAYSYYVASNIKTGNYQKSATSGNSIYAPNAKANTAKPSGVIREVAGQMNIYPDLICPPRRRYENQIEYLYLMLSVGAGYYDISGQNLYIAETNVTNYAGDIEYEIFEPGSDISGSIASENWYQTLEVSDLLLTTASDIRYGVWTVDYSGDEITSYLDGVATEFPFQIDEIFEITGGSNPGYYKVVAISGVDNEIAQVAGYERVGGDSGRLEALTKQVVVRTKRGYQAINRVLFSSTGTPSLVSAAGEAITQWQGLNGGVNWEGPFRLTPEGETTRYSEVDVFFDGLSDLDNDNENISTSVTIEIEWREIGTSTWTTVTKQYTDSTYDQLGFTESIDYGSDIEPEIRVRRVTRDAEEIQLANNVLISRIKSKLETLTSYSDITTIAMRLRGTNALASTAENRINLRGATRKLPTLDEMEAGTFNLSDSATKVSTVGDVTTVGVSLESSLEIFEVFVTFGNFAGVDFSADGLQMLIYDSGYMKLFTLTTAFRPDQGYVYNGYQTLGGSNPYSARFGDSGSYIYDIRKQPDPGIQYVITQSTMSTPYDISTLTVTNSITIGLEVDTGISITIKDDGTKLWIGDGGSDRDIKQYSMSTAWDITTLTYDSITFDPTEISSDFINAIYITSEKIYVGTDDSTILQYSMTTDWDTSTVTYDGLVNIGSESIREIHVSDGVLTVSHCVGAGLRNLVINSFSLPQTSDTRATRSLARFLGWQLYDANAGSTIDYSSLGSLEGTWESRADYLDAEFVDETTLWEAITVGCAVGYAEPTIKDGLFLPVRQAATETLTQLYTPDIMLGDGVQIDNNFADNNDPDGVDVEYFDLTTNQMEVVECRLSGDAGVRPERVQSIGITNNTKAWRFGMRERRRLFYKPATITFSTELDALNSEFGDNIAVASGLFASQHGYVTDVTGSVVTLSFDPEGLGTGTWYASFRQPDGTASVLHRIEAGASANKINLLIPSFFSFTPIYDDDPYQTPTLVTIGQALEWSKQAIVRRVSPDAEDSVTITAQEYISAIYADDDNSPS